MRAARGFSPAAIASRWTATLRSLSCRPGVVGRAETAAAIAEIERTTTRDEPADRPSRGHGRSTVSDTEATPGVRRPCGSEWLLVPRGGIEPPTRGFSVPSSPSRRGRFPSREVRQAPLKTRQARYAEARSCTVALSTRRQQPTSLRWDHNGCPRAGQRLGSNRRDAGRSRRPAERLATESATRSGSSSRLRAPFREHRCVPPALASCRAGSDVARARLDQAGKQRAGSGLVGTPRNADGTDRIARRPQGTRREGARVVARTARDASPLPPQKRLRQGTRRAPDAASGQEMGVPHEHGGGFFPDPLRTACRPSLKPRHSSSSSDASIASWQLAPSSSGYEHDLQALEDIHPCNPSKWRLSSLVIRRPRSSDHAGGSLWRCWISLRAFWRRRSKQASPSPRQACLVVLNGRVL